VPEAISNTSPLVYLHRVGALDWLGHLFGEVWVPSAVIKELQAGRAGGHDVPLVGPQPWVRIVEPRATPSEWLSLDLGPGELAALALALENPSRIVLLDDQLARRTGQAAGLNVWGTLRVLLEAKAQGLTERIEPLVGRLGSSGMWISQEIRRRILTLADEADEIG
jgi:predicted nucleic acid-binding protein